VLDQLSELVLEGQDVLGGNSLGRVTVASADGFEQCPLFLDDVFETGREGRVAAHRDLEDAEREVVVVVERLGEKLVLRAAVITPRPRSA
jgi:hypothetical protein